MQCGHYIPRGRLWTKFHPLNNFMQCQECNEFKDGEQKKFGKKLTRIYSQSYVDYLWNLSRRNATWMDDQWYQDQVKYYIEATTLLKKIKNMGGKTPPELFTIQSNEHGPYSFQQFISQTQ